MILASSKSTPPHTTNTTNPNAHIGIGLCFAILSFRDNLVGFLPARASLANFSFF